MLADLDFQGWAVIQGELEASILAEAKRAGAGMIQQIGLSGVENDVLFNQVDEFVVEYAKRRSAEMVGMKWVDGELVNNPNAKFAITEKTRQGIKADVLKALEEGKTSEQLKGILEENNMFSEARARSIAITELSQANGKTGMESWKASGVVEKKQWLLSGDHTGPDSCDENANAGAIPVGDAFPSGHQHNPAHPTCWCDTVAIVSEGFF